MSFGSKSLTVTQDEVDELRHISASRTLPTGDVFRARLILMLAEAHSYLEIQQRLNTTAPTISHWKKRFLQRASGRTDA